MATQLDVYNQALLALKESTLASLTEERESRRVLDALWTDVRLKMIEAGFWKFAVRAVSITQDTSITPAFGYSKAFNKPSDWVKTYMVSASEYFDPPHYDWIEESSLFFSDIDPIYVRYISNASPGYGFDPGRWTGRFVEAFAFELAWRAAPKAAGSSDTLTDSLDKQKIRALSSALSFEALREPIRRPPQGLWNSVRGAKGGGNWSGGYRIG
jgi:hypothetical protein